MSKITTKLPVDVTINNDLKIGTRDRDIISASIKAPDINSNLLTQEHVMKNCYSSLPENNFKKYSDHFHCDFRRFPPNTSDEIIIAIPLSSIHFKSNTKYTITFIFYNMIGSYSPSYGTQDITFYYNNSQSSTSGGLIPVSGTKSFGFKIPSVSTQIRSIVWQKHNWMPGFNQVFDMKIISLVEGDTPLLTETPSLDSYSKQSLITSNECNSLGSYSISPYIRKHIQTVEHNITKQENLYDINWR